MTKIIFANDGEIDARAIKTFGVSSKETDNPIGFFGTGLKYAIAILLRHGCQVDLFIGLQRHKFTTKRTKIRVDDFDVVCMNGEELGFTTELGKTWELWMAYRELYCNTVDEDGDIFIQKTATPAADRTLVVVGGDDFIDIHHKRSQFILETAPYLQTKELEVHKGQTHSIFYRGFKVMQTLHCLFTYNILSKMELTEDRTLKDQWSASYQIVKGIENSEDEAFIEAVVTAQTGTFERDLDFDWTSLTPGPVFLETVGRLLKMHGSNVNASAETCYRKHRPASIVFVPVTMTAVEQATLDRAVDALKAAGWKVDNFPIVTVESLGTDTLGRADSGTIYISRRAFSMGTKIVAATVLEEFVHLRHKYKDCCYPMQNFLFETLVSMIEEHVLKEPF